MDKAIIEFAEAITTLSIVKEYSPEVALNGVAIAATTMLLDVSIKSDGRVNEQALEDVREYFQAALTSALSFARKQIADGVLRG